MLRFNKNIYTLASFLCLVFIAFFVNKGSAHAVTAGDWRAGSIISDDIFYNNADMSAIDIQNFLNTKVSCDTNGTKIYSGSQTRAQWAASNGKPLPPYICLKDYTQGGKSAAQIIKEAADTYRISSKSLIVLLQKEQALVTDDWPWPNQYRSATGYGCPDTAPCDAEYYGFRNQVMKAAYQFRRYATYPTEYRYKPYQSNYIQYNPVASCGGTNVNIENLATAGLYNYTPYQPNESALNNLYGSGDGCGAYGNRNFWRLFNDWFGNTQAFKHDCDSKVTGTVCVWSMLKTDGSQFLTSSKSERDNTINNYGWRYEGISFYASQAQKQGTIPVYRLRYGGQHYYTANASERSTLISSDGWTDEGVAFYAYPAATSGNMSHEAYKLYSASKNQHYLTSDSGQRQLLIQGGYNLGTSTFRGLSGSADLPLVDAGRQNVYRLRGGINYFYTTSLQELETLMDVGYTYEGVITTASDTSTGAAVYRLRYGYSYLYTTSTVERDNAVRSYGMSNEGVGFYLDSNSTAIYRLANTISNKYLYTSSITEVMSLTNTNGWRYENMLNYTTSTTSPVYRFLNSLNGRHFYTIDINEASRITNRVWKYETISFSASKSSGLPVYRLLANDKHLFTVNSNEKEAAIGKYGYVYEGVAFYVSPTTTATPVYRLQGGNDEYFYTISASEKNSAVSKYGYRYEGEGFYLQSGN